MFYFAFAEIVEMRVPARKRYEIVRHAFRQENMPGIAAIHHALSHVDTGTGDIGPLVYIQDYIDRPAMNSHPQPNLGMIFYCRADLHCTFNWRFMIAKKHKRHSIAGWQANQFLLGFGATKSRTAFHNARQLAHDAALLCDEQRRVLDHVHVQDMRRSEEHTSE